MATKKTTSKAKKTASSKKAKTAKKQSGFGRNIARQRQAKPSSLMLATELSPFINRETIKALLAIHACKPLTWEIRQYGIEECRKHLALPEVPYERNVTQSRAQNLYDGFDNDTVTGFYTHITVIRYGGVDYRGDGQKTCWAAIAKAEEEARKGNLDYRIAVIYLHVEAPTEEAMCAFYAEIDTNQVRPYGSRVAINLHSFAQKHRLDHQSVEWAIRGMRMWRYPKTTDKNRATPGVLARRIVEDDPTTFIEATRFMAEMRHDGTCRVLLKRPYVCAAILATFDVHPVRARGFWTAVLKMTGIEGDDDPRRHCHFQLHAEGRGPSGEQKKLRDAELYRMCLEFWNRFRLGYAVQRRVVPKKVPKLKGA